ncbi:hypothetical protein N7462_007603 [Penicillium macrosclerotiorum]|uniref:uncharacterized protein n=1 Tax=Penicillium macrosclerotiorum TaxID=303699 RepID=UPI0025497777|nr:uncharacterized protein N7462_007603 [Penicillium macrosclerotiorum]KAJ5679359.1 hypothetical protein N7462_007603 [Penicillium macrosclerotiorum]
MSHSVRSSQSSYGDPRYLSAATVSDVHAPLAKSLVDGYRDAVNPQYEDRSQYNPLNPAHPRSSALLNTSDPVMMYLLTETAMGDSTNFPILSFEEVEDLKKERSLLTTRVEGTKRKLALETKLRDAAQSIGRLYSPPSPRNSNEYGANGTAKSHRRSRSIFGRSGNGTTEVLDKSDSELAMSQRKCEDLAQELWKLERRAQQINQRLLEHTAGVLQMTHKGLRKAPRNPNESSGLDDGHDFDDRSLYRTTEHLDNYGMHGKIEMNGPPAAVDAESQKRLEDLSERMCNMMIQAHPDEFVDPPPQPGGPASTIGAHIAYLESGLQSLSALKRVVDTSANPAPAAEDEGAAKQQLTYVNNQVQSIVDRFGLTRSPTLPPPPTASDGEGLEEQIAYLQAGVDGLASRVDGLLEQKSILTTQIQQQRELNSKSDAERDAHIADLTEQLAHARRDLDVSEREAKASRDELAVLTEQLEAMRHDDSSQEEAKAALIQTEGEVARLQSVIESLHEEADVRAEEVREAHDRAEHAELEIKAALERTAQIELEILAAHERAEHAEADTRAAHERAAQAEFEIQAAHDRAEHAESEINAVRDRVEQEVQEARGRSEQELAQLEANIQQVRYESDERVKEALDQRAQAEENSTRLQNEMTELEGEVVRITTELTMVKAELDGAYGTRAQRAAEVAANPEIQKEIDNLNTRNIELTEELAALKSQQGGGGAQQRADTLERELRETIDDYEAMTKASIEFEKERERFEGVIDSMRDRCEQLEQQLSEERINWMNLNSPGSVGRDGTSETTSTMVLKNEFKKMMRDTRNENMKILRVSPLSFPVT